MTGGGLDSDFGGSYPFAAHHLDAPGGRLHYLDEGPREAPAVLLLHGNVTWSYLWRNVVRALTARGHRCVAPDHVGFGRSARLDRLSDYSFDGHIANVVALLDALDLRQATLVGHDWGGPIGLGALLERPERLRAAVIMNSWAWQLPSYLPPFLREFRTEGRGEILALGANLLVEMIPGGMHRRDPDPVMMDAYRAPFPDFRSRLAPLALMREIPLSPQDRSYVRFGRISQALAELDIPLRLVWGMRDPTFQGVFIDQWRELFPGARAIELEHASHFLVEDCPDEVSAAVADFLAEL